MKLDSMVLSSFFFQFLQIFISCIFALSCFRGSTLFENAVRCESPKLREVWFAGSSFVSVAVEMDHQPPNFVCSQVHKTRSVLETTQVKLAIR